MAWGGTGFAAFRIIYETSVVSPPRRKLNDTNHEYKLGVSCQQSRCAGKISRRDFLHLAMAAGFTLSAAQGHVHHSRARRTQEGRPLQFGCGHGQTTDLLDPATWSNGFTFHFGRSLFGAPLIQIGAKNEAIPHVAESFEPSDGAKKWVIQAPQGHHLS